MDVSDVAIAQEHQVVYSNNKEKELGYRIIKRIFDIIISIIACIFLIPITIIIKIAYLIAGDKASIIFKQERIGKNGKPIYIYKFRSMVPNAEQLLDELMEKNSKIRDEYLQNKKLKNDPRLTRIGKIIRRYSIDELPQFINVLIGDMSVVGPRPYLYREKEDMGIYYNYVINSKPGITGMWQVNGRSNTAFYKRLLLDKEYDMKKSILCDLGIFFKTFWKVLKKEGSE